MSAKAKKAAKPALKPKDARSERIDAAIEAQRERVLETMSVVAVCAMAAEGQSYLDLAGALELTQKTLSDIAMELGSIPTR